MPRTTLNLDQSVLEELKARGERERRSIGDIASDLLAVALHDAAPAAPEPFAWKSASLGVPLVNLNDREAVRRVLDAT